MASLPQSQRRRLAPQRSGSDLQNPAFPQAESSLTRSDSISAKSEDSQTILISGRASQDAATSTAADSKQQQQQQQQEERPEPRRCWICFSDEGDEQQPVSEWRSPCPCALTAHETCLLDWVANLEAPSARRRSSKILCPQCKSEIILARPKSYIVTGVNALENLSSRLVLPGVLSLAVASFWYLCWVHGKSAIFIVFGPRDADQILGPLRLHNIAEAEEGSSLVAFARHVRQRWRLDLGLSLIPPMLISSRSSFADGILPILPMLFFVTKPDPDPLVEFGKWPPSAGLSFALLPYLRSIYNTYYEQVWAERERRWLAEVEPRAADADAGNGANADNADDVLEINVNLAVLEEWDDGPVVDQNIQVIAPPAPIAPEVPAPAAPAPQQANAPNQANANAPAPPPPADNRNFNLTMSTTRLAETILGALAFPAVSAAMGELLRLTLPKAWTARQGPGTKAAGLLQARWGRSLIGGCAFVVMRDAIMLYVRWRMARDHRRRRVLDYDRKKKRAARPGERA
ncbi:hypothetical protein EJ06DRAFT_532160 [Trichodelitschia bisporula]|uniref:RING-CH-type domain-containing protein n=1 Tax=Trichodelitschia bisporula TaxID=703511 RepID=A0A6G1HQS3_9PEZI|nr:hypothetical protein EJ06DRAFT_532160 [Trichodelitschia bisporula]